jgi:FkbM family methyltransferase
LASRSINSEFTNAKSSICCSSFLSHFNRFDVGANIGNHTLYFAKLFKRVHAFEPNPRTFELLRFNTQWSVDVRVHCHGLGDNSGVFELIEHKTNLGGSSILIGDKCADNLVAINIETLDNGSVDATDLCFMKIDVEGFEAQVIKGGIKTLKQHQPVIVLEQHASEFNGGSSPALDLLASMGYGFCWQQQKSPTRSWITRRLQNLKEFTFGIRHSIATGAIVPPVNHSMLIAIPPRFKQLLGMK